VASAGGSSALASTFSGGDQFGYISEVDVAQPVEPMDSGAWFEAYLGEWHNFDAHNKTPRVGRAIVLIASFGHAQPDRLS
jgi:transglutaminase-like putative cysteine protease